MSRIFISYRREDSADAAGRLHDRLVAVFGADEVFKDVDSIPLGIDFRKVLSDAVASCDVLLAVIGCGWLGACDPAGRQRLASSGDFVRIEIEAALERGIPVIPVLVQGASLPPAKALPESLRDLVFRHAIAVRPDPDFHRDVDRLLQGLKRLAPLRVAGPRAEVVDTQRAILPAPVPWRTRWRTVRTLIILILIPMVVFGLMFLILQHPWTSR